MIPTSHVMTASVQVDANGPMECLVDVHGEYVTLALGPTFEIVFDAEALQRAEELLAQARRDLQAAAEAAGQGH